MVNWILNSKAPETFETCSLDDIWVMVDSYFCGWWWLWCSGIQMWVWQTEFLIKALSKTQAFLYALKCLPSFLLDCFKISHPQVKHSEKQRHYSSSLMQCSVGISARDLLVWHSASSSPPPRLHQFAGQRGATKGAGGQIPWHIANLVTFSRWTPRWTLTPLPVVPCLELVWIGYISGHKTTNPMSSAWLGEIFTCFLLFLATLEATLALQKLLTICGAWWRSG